MVRLIPGGTYKSPLVFPQAAEGGVLLFPWYVHTLLRAPVNARWLPHPLTHTPLSPTSLGLLQGASSRAGLTLLGRTCSPQSQRCVGRSGRWAGRPGRWVGILGGCGLRRGGNHAHLPLVVCPTWVPTTHLLQLPPGSVLSVILLVWHPQFDKAAWGCFSNEGGGPRHWAAHPGTA